MTRTVCPGAACSWGHTPNFTPICGVCEKTPEELGVKRPRRKPHSRRFFCGLVPVHDAPIIETDPVKA